MVLQTLDTRVEQGILVATIVNKNIIEESYIAILGNQLHALVTVDGHKKIVLSFENVGFYSSAALGKLITLDKLAGGKRGLVLCSMRPAVYESFEITRLNRVFEIKTDLDAALRHFGVTMQNKR